MKNKEACGQVMRKNKMQNLNDLRVNEAFEKFVISKKAQGVKDVTIRDYHYHFRSMSKYLYVEKHFSECLSNCIFEYIFMRDVNGGRYP